MEYEIGRVITLPDGRKAEVVENETCVGCITSYPNCLFGDYGTKLGKCDCKDRTDHKNIIYKEIKED